MTPATESRPLVGAPDFDAMTALARACASTAVHVVDLSYRFSSWAFDDPDNTRLWVGAEGQLAAWAVLQPPFWNLDYVHHPSAGPDLPAEILAWADERARACLDTPSSHPMWFACALDSDAARLRDLQAAGYYSVAEMGDDSWSQVRLLRVGPPPPSLSLPEGFVIRPLAGEDEVAPYIELHRAVFQSKNMTEAWRARTLRQPAYLPELDLVVAAPDGRLVAFCVAWLDQHMAPVSGQIEPLGVHADFRRLGLGRAILDEGVRRLHMHGAQRIYVMTDDFGGAAFGLYTAAGFQIEHKVWVYRKDFPEDSQ